MYFVIPEFKKPLVGDKIWIKKIFNFENNINSDSSLGTLFLWSDVFDVKICNFNNILLKKHGNLYEFPKGYTSKADLKNALENLIYNAKINRYEKFKISGILSKEVLKLQEIFKDKFEIIKKRNDFEYIYKSKDLALLNGKKYHSKKNHITKFSKLYNWTCKYINLNNKEKYIRFFEKWFSEHNFDGKNIYENSEYKAIRKAFDLYKELELVGISIEIDDKIVACSIGEKINDKAFLIHFEKALSDYSEAYSVINNEFAKILFKKFEFINREEDLGIEGLRKAKLSYKPIDFIYKYDAVLKEF